MTTSQALLQTVIEAARARGLDQRELAVKAGLTPEPAPSASTRSPLADPKWGLAWSNPNASVEALVQNALIRGSFFPVLEAVLAHGLDFVRDQWTVVCSNPDEAPSQKSRRFMEKMLAGIEKGLRRAES